MAEGDDKQTESLRLESDDFHEYPCLPCAKDNRNVAAIKYCVDCDENICEKCVSAHNKYAGLKGHQVSDTIKTTPVQGGPGLPSQRCDIHAGKLIDVYCADHEFVGCSTCIAIDHRSCTEVKFIPDVAPTLTSTELRDLVSRVKELEGRIDTIKQEKANCIQNLNQNKDKIVQDIRILRQKINDHLDQMEKTMLEEVDVFFNNKLELVNGVINNINCVAETLSKTQKVICKVGGKNESEQFVDLKKSKSVLCSSSVILKSLEVCPFVSSTSFYLNKAIEQVLQKARSYGGLLDASVFNSSPVRSEFNIRLESDEYDCEIRSICMIQNSDLVLIDRANKKLKIFDTNFVIKEHVVTDGVPFDVCEVDDFRLAVSLFDKRCVQFVSRQPLKLENSFMVGDKCRGLRYNDGKLFVCCGGLKRLEEGAGHIEVYSTKGKLLRSYYESFVCPWYIYISENGTNMFVSDFVANTMSEIDLCTNKAHKLKFQNVIKPSGMCTIDLYRQRIICGFQSNNIIIQSEEQKQIDLLTEKDGIVKPRSICFDKRNLRLFVSLDNSDIVKVFTFHE